MSLVIPTKYVLLVFPVAPLSWLLKNVSSTPIQGDATILFVRYLTIGRNKIIVTSSVSANSISKISMDIYVDASGNAQVTEVWKANLTAGSEGYHPYYNLNNSSIIFNSVKIGRASRR